MLALIGVLLATLIERGVERDETAGRGHGGLDLDTKQSRRLGRPQRVAAPPRKKAVEEEDEEELLEDLEEMADRQNDDDDAAETATAQPEEATSDEEEQRLEKEEQIIEQLELKELEKAQKEAKKKSKKTEEDKDFHFNSLPAPKKVVRMWSDHNMTQDGLYPKVIGIGGCFFVFGGLGFKIQGSPFLYFFNHSSARLPKVRHKLTICVSFIGFLFIQTHPHSRYPSSSTILSSFPTPATLKT